MIVGLAILIIILYLSIFNFIGLEDFHKSVKDNPIRYEVH